MQAGVHCSQKSCRLCGAPDCKVVVCLVGFLGPSQLCIPLAQIQFLHVCIVSAEFGVYTLANVQQQGQTDRTWLNYRTEEAGTASLFASKDSQGTTCMSVSDSNMPVAKVMA